jgi:hypothetical protein
MAKKTRCKMMKEVKVKHEKKKTAMHKDKKQDEALIKKMVKKDDLKKKK